MARPTSPVWLTGSSPRFKLPEKNISVAVQVFSHSLRLCKWERKSPLTLGSVNVDSSGVTVAGQKWGVTLGGKKDYETDEINETNEKIQWVN